MSRPLVRHLPMETFVVHVRRIMPGLMLLAAACQAVRSPAPPPPPGAPPAAVAPARAVYRHSVLPGGVQSGAEVKQRLKEDAPAAAHYRNIRPEQLKPVHLAQDRRAYVSYRVGDKIYWTRKPQLIKAGELVLTDGEQTVRARCGNRVEDEPQDEVQSADESPADEEFDQIAELDGHWPVVGAPSGRAGRQLKDLVEPMFAGNQTGPPSFGSGGGSTAATNPGNSSSGSGAGNHWGGFPNAGIGGSGSGLPWEPGIPTDGNSPYPQSGSDTPGRTPILPPPAPNPVPDAPIPNPPAPNPPGPDTPNPWPPDTTPKTPPEPPPYGPPVKPPPTSPPPSPWSNSPIPSPPWPEPPNGPNSPPVPPVEPKPPDMPRRPPSPPWSPGPPQSPDPPFAPDRPEPIPEPTTGVLLALGAGLLVIGYRRQRS